MGTTCMLSSLRSETARVSPHSLTLLSQQTYVGNEQIYISFPLLFVIRHYVALTQITSPYIHLLQLSSLSK